MSKFHVGDRWADQHGKTWLVLASANTSVTAALIHSDHTRMERFGPIGGSSGDTGERLTRLISSERWIPFAEMMPDAPSDGEKRVVVAYVADEQDPYLFRVCNGHWIASDEFAYWSLPELTPEGAHWRYITPPEAS